MSAVLIRRPILKLTTMLREAGGIPISEAVAAAEANLKASSADYMRALSDGVTEAAAMAANSPATYDEGSLDGLYEHCRVLIGLATACQRRAIDVTLVSLCDLLDHFRTRKIWDRDAIMVHTDALRMLIMTSESDDKAGERAVLAGLKRVTSRYGGDAKGE